ncbi:uncharacterized protein LOC110985011 [Acanthaster planci]|uniref:Uncharacterized protein LOC110985011 n=1 Tax=Acanthaster planci TaxID=133434 RepID=A0A8B7Z6W1_ACAPL|nr:uncharacterized protein LOC110985011 [Acanthaster planci]
MEGKLLIVLFVLSSSFGAFALNCHVCPFFGVCKDGEVGELKSCASLNGTVANQCLKFDGAYSAVFRGATATFRGSIRNCNLLPKDSEPPPLRCLSTSESSGYLTRNLQYATDLVPYVSNVTIQVTSGHLCFCDADGCNGVDSVKPFLSLLLISGLMHLFMM